MIQLDDQFRSIQEKVEQGLRVSYEVPNNVIQAMPEPLVTVRTITYQHAPYIRQCIEGVLMQRTSFPVEYIIGEDLSTDGTREIVLEYAAKYPDRIRVLTADSNVGMRVNTRRTNLALRGKYCALCEGDDFWTDPLKLQKQVDFLEANPDYALTYHDARVEDPKGNVVLVSKIPKGMARDHSEEELLLNKTFILTLTMLYRNNTSLWRDPPHEGAMVLNGDNFLTSRLGLSGKGKFMADIMPAVYRQHTGGVWSPLSQTARDRAQINSWMWMGAYYDRIGRPDVARHFFERVSGRVKPMFEWYELRHRKAYQLFARIMGWFKIDLPR
jgi:glycosyltransferase involved in cell wall biosynthesis